MKMNMNSDDIKKGEEQDYLVFTVMEGVAGFFWLVVRERPQLHPRCNQAEVELISGGMETDASKKIGSIPLGDIVRSPSLWFSSLSQIGINIGWIFIGTWFPTYLLEQYQVYTFQLIQTSQLPY